MGDIALGMILLEFVASGGCHCLWRGREIARLRSSAGAIPMPIAKSSIRLELRSSVGLRLADLSPYTAQSFLKLSKETRSIWSAPQVHNREDSPNPLTGIVLSAAYAGRRSRGQRRSSVGERHVVCHGWEADRSSVFGRVGYLDRAGYR